MGRHFLLVVFWVVLLKQQCITAEAKDYFLRKMMPSYQECQCMHQIQSLDERLSNLESLDKKFDQVENNLTFYFEKLLVHLDNWNTNRMIDELPKATKDVMINSFVNNEKTSKNGPSKTSRNGFFLPMENKNPESELNTYPDTQLNLKDFWQKIMKDISDISKHTSMLRKGFDDETTTPETVKSMPEVTEMQEMLRKNSAFRLFQRILREIGELEKEDLTNLQLEENYPTLFTIVYLLNDLLSGKDTQQQKVTEKETVEVEDAVVKNLQHKLAQAEIAIKSLEDEVAMLSEMKYSIPILGSQVMELQRMMEEMRHHAIQHDATVNHHLQAGEAIMRSHPFPQGFPSSYSYINPMKMRSGVPGEKEVSEKSIYGNQKMLQFPWEE